MCTTAYLLHTYRRHTHVLLTALFLGLPGWAGTRKVKPIWILLKKETVTGSGISWAICKSAPRSRQITTPAPHHSVFYRPDALPAAQPTASKRWRDCIHTALIEKRRNKNFPWCLVSCGVSQTVWNVQSARRPNLTSKCAQQLRCPTWADSYSVPLQSICSLLLHSMYRPGAWFTKYLTIILWISYDNAKVMIHLWRTSNLQNISRRTQGFS